MVFVCWQNRPQILLVMHHTETFSNNFKHYDISGFLTSLTPYLDSSFFDNAPKAVQVGT